MLLYVVSMLYGIVMWETQGGRKCSLGVRIDVIGMESAGHGIVYHFHLII